MWYIGATICIFNYKLQKTPLKKNHMKKWKWLKKYSQYFYKIIILVVLSVFASKSGKQVAPLTSRPNQNAWI